MTPDANTSLIASTARPRLEQALREKLVRRCAQHGSMGELEPLAIRLGLIQSTLKPRLKQPQLLVFAGDHGLAVDVTHPGESGTDQLVDNLLTGRVPLPVFAHMQGIHFHLVDSGMATPLRAQPGVMARKIAHGTRNCRMAPAMSMEQVHSAIRAGMEIAQELPGNAVGCAGIGIGSHEAAALVINRLGGLRLHDLMFAGPQMDAILLEQRLTVLQAAQTRHVNTDDPVEVLAAYGGFETAMMVGVMLVAASQRRLILVDGLAACAALMVASRIGGSVSDFCVFCRSTRHLGLDVTLAAFGASALLEVGMESMDGTGVPMTWPIIQAAATLMTQVSSGDEADTLAGSGQAVVTTPGELGALNFNTQDPISRWAESESDNAAHALNTGKPQHGDNALLPAFPALTEPRPSVLAD